MARRSSDRYVSVDIETDGPIPGEYSMLSLGAVDAFDPDRSFYSELQPISDNVVPEALAVSGLDRERLRLEGELPIMAMRRFVEWSNSLDGRPVFCSFSGWDYSFVYAYLIRFIGKSGNPYGHSSLDMKSLVLGRYGGDWGSTSKSSIKRLHPELLEGAGPHTHNALDDAREQAVLLRRVLESPR